MIPQYIVCVNGQDARFSDDFFVQLLDIHAAERDGRMYRTDGFPHCLHFGGRIAAANGAAEDSLGCPKALEKIGLIRPQHGGNGNKIFHFVIGAADGGAELVGDTAGFEKYHALLGLFGCQLGKADRFGVFFPRVFHVHGDIIDKAAVDNIFELHGKKAVGVNFNRKAHVLDLPAEEGQILLQHRLTAGDADALQRMLSLFQKSKDLLFGYDGEARGMEHQISVMAEGTAQITTAGKNGAGGLSRKIEECQLLKAVDGHDCLPKQSKCRKIRRAYIEYYKILFLSIW